MLQLHFDLTAPLASAGTLCLGWKCAGSSYLTPFWRDTGGASCRAGRWGLGRVLKHVVSS